MSNEGAYRGETDTGAAYATASVIDPKRSTTRAGTSTPFGPRSSLSGLGSITQPRGCAGIVHSVRAGRESRFEFDPQPLNELQEYLGRVSEQWDQVLSRLKTLVERVHGGAGEPLGLISKQR